MNTKALKITQVRSKNGRLKAHKGCLLGLGIKRMNQTVYVEDNASMRGIVSKISYMLKVEKT